MTSVVDERSLRNALNASLVGVAILENDEYKYVNDAHAEVYGYDDPETFVGETWQTCYTDARVDDLDPAFEALAREGEWRGELEAVRADGSTFPQELSLSTLSSGGFVCVVRDLTGQRQHEAELETLNEATRALMTADDCEDAAETQHVSLAAIAERAWNTLPRAAGRGPVTPWRTGRVTATEPERMTR